MQFVAAGKTRVYATDRIGRLQVLSAANGALLDAIPTENVWTKLINADTDRVYLVSETGLIQCLREVEQLKPLMHGKDRKEAARAESKRQPEQETPPPKPTVEVEKPAKKAEPKTPTTPKERPAPKERPKKKEVKPKEPRPKRGNRKGAGNNPIGPPNQGPGIGPGGPGIGPGGPGIGPGGPGIGPGIGPLPPKGKQ